MKDPIRTYEHKLYQSALVCEYPPLIGCMDAEIQWNRPDPQTFLLEKVFDAININAMILARPAQPYALILDYLAKTSDGVIRPQDCETKTFLHELPVIRRLDAGSLIDILSQRKCAVIPGLGIVSYGTVSLEQAYVTFSSVCFSAFVKFFSDLLSLARNNRLTQENQAVFDAVVGHLSVAPRLEKTLMPGPFSSGEEVRQALCEAGSQLVAHGLVDSYFGNISYRSGPVLYISQTGSSLDALEDCIDPCPLDGSSCAAITASSELPAHVRIVQATDRQAVLHGHPKFSVILSMDCDERSCPDRGKCHIRCPRNRFVCDTPVVSGQVGAGPLGLCRTVPPALQSHPGVIVYGHGLFTTGRIDFNEAYQHCLDVENVCRKEYFARMNRFG